MKNIVGRERGGERVKRGFKDGAAGAEGKKKEALRGFSFSVSVYLGKRGRSNTPWHTSCENSVQGGILQ